MQTTMELYAKAVEKQTPADWARVLNMTPEAFYVANKKGRLSPVIAGNLAAELGEDPMEWVAVAALEQAKDSEQLQRLRQRVNRWRRR